MSEPTSTMTHEVAPMVRRRRWIDAALVAAGLVCVASGRPAIGAPLVALGLIMPVLHWFGRRQHGAGRIAHLVPAELAQGRAEVLAAATLPGVPRGAAAIEAADDMVLEVAAVLAGREPRGGAQRRFVTARVRALQSTAADLRDWHESWRLACDEVEGIAPTTPPAAVPAPAADGHLVTALVVLLFPVFLVWDVVRAGGRGMVGLLDGLALRIRTTARLVVRAGGATVDYIQQAARSWARLRDATVEATTEARRRFLALRLRVQLRLRLARRAVR